MNNRNNNELKYFIYVRKSSEAEDRQMSSVEDQLKILNKKAKEENLNIVEIMQESKSAKVPNKRIVFSSMMEKLHKGEADAILCWKLNRLSRNSLEGGLISHSLETEVIKEIKTPGKTYYPNDNVLTMAVELGMATQYSKDLAKDTKRGLLEKAKRGWYPAPAPAGYMKHPDMKKGEKEIIIDKERFDAVRKIWDLVLTGEYNPRQALDYVSDKYKLKNKKSKKYGVSTVYHILKNTFFYGDYEYPKTSGNWYNGKHTPMITKKEFDRVQELINPHSKTNNETELKDLFPYKGLVCGECGSSITAERKRRITCDCKYRFSALKNETCPKCKTHLSNMKNAKDEKNIYYHCTKKKNKSCEQNSYQPSNIEDSIKEKLKELTIPSDFIDVGLELLETIRNKENKLEEKTSKILLKDIVRIEKDLDRLLDLRMCGDLDSKTYKARKEVLEDEKKELKVKLKDRDKEELKEKAKYYFEFSIDAVNKFSNAEANKKKSIFHTLGSNQIIIDGKIEIITDTALFDFLEVSKAYRDYKSKVRTSKNTYSIIEKTPSRMSNSILLHR